MWAKRTAGTAALYLDCAVPIPADEGFIKVISNGVSYGEEVGFGQAPYGVFQGFGNSGSAWTIAQSLFPENFVLPPGDGRIYAVFESGPDDINYDIAWFNEGNIGKFYERWISLRGND